MKLKTYLFAMTLIVCLGSMAGCSKTGCTSVNACNYDDDAKTDDGTCINKGQVTFWQNSSTITSDIEVTINATSATITSPQSAVPTCGASGCATFSLCPGSHHYTAREEFPGTATWSGDVTATEDGCLVVQLL